MAVVGKGAHQTMAKASVEHLPDNGGLRFMFATGETLVAPLETLAPGMVTRLALHGLEQKLRDSYSGADPEECAGLAQKVWDNLSKGVWTSRPPGGVGTSGKKLLVRAVEAVLRESGKPVPAELAETIDSLSRSERAKLRADPRVAVKLAELKSGGESVLDTLF